MQFVDDYVKVLRRCLQLTCNEGKSIVIVGWSGQNGSEQGKMIRWLFASNCETKRLWL